MAVTRSPTTAAACLLALLRRIPLYDHAVRADGCAAP
jgi:hypothetical protein